MGGDSLQDLPHWYRPEEFLSALDGIGVMRRPGDEIDITELLDVLPMLVDKLNFVTAPLLEIAANQIRGRVSDERAYRYYLTPEVYRYIREKGLYQD